MTLLPAGPDVRPRHARAATCGPVGQGLRVVVLVAVIALAVGLAHRGGLLRVLPALPAHAAGAPLAAPALPPAGSGGYRFIERQDDGSGRPVRWDPCRPVHYVVATAGATPSARSSLRAGLARLEQVTGLRFVDDGTTEERPRADRPAVDRDRYGDRFAPVLIAWTTPSAYPGIAGYAGLGGPQSVAGRHPGQRRFVSGMVLLNAEYLDGARRRAGGAEAVQAVVRHELGHLVGLDHVDDPGQLMYPRPGGDPADYAAGDLRGLAALSGGPCFRDF